MARNLQVLDSALGISANVKYEPLNLSDKNKAKIIFKSNAGKEVKLTTVGEDRKPISTYKAYLDEDGIEYAKGELVAHDEANEVIEQYESTSVFNIVKYEPMGNYTDKYVVDKFYELSPSDGGKKKDIDRQLASDINLSSMKKLYDHLVKNQVVAKAEFVATVGYKAGAGYLRAISVEGKWTIELGVFREAKIFKHLQEPNFAPVKAQAPKRKAINKLL